MSVQEDWAGMALECPNCKKTLTCPQFSSPDSTPFAPKSPMSSGAQGAPEQPGASGKFLRKAGSVAVIAIIGLVIFLVQSRMEENHIRDEIRNLFASASFIYSGAQLTDIKKQSGNNYTVTFRRDGKTYRRPIRYRTTGHNKAVIELAFQYKDRQDYLLEDAGLLWENIKKNNADLSSYRMIDAKPQSAGVVRLTLANGNRTEKADLHITNKESFDGTAQIEYRLTPVY